jgi:hypothetical protein
MSLFVRAPLMLAAFLLNGPVAAQEILGTPPALIGSYSTTLQQCEVGKLEYGLSRQGFYGRLFEPKSTGDVLSHRITSKGFILNLINDRCERWSEEVTVIDDQTIRVEGNESKTLLRCPAEGEAIIGLSPRPRC